MMRSSRFEDDIQLEDLIAFYPPSFVDKIQTKISGKKEFKELASDPIERLKKARGDYFKHQKFIQRFLQHYDDLLLFHETGTGKSCAMTATAELLKQQHLRGDTHIDHAYFIVNNKQLKERIINEIVCKCTDGVYDIIRPGKDPKREVNKNLRQWYTVIERETFARRLALLSNEDIVRDYSNAIFFIDEAHNLRFEPFTGEIEEEEEDIGRKLRKDELRQFKVKSLRKLAEEVELEDAPEKKVDLIQVLSNIPSLTLDKIKEVASSEEYELIKKTKKKVRPEFSKEDQYIQYWRLFHVAKNIKRVLATATPMVNESAEIRDLINLLLPSTHHPLPDFQTRYINIQRLDPFLDIPSDVNISDMTDDELEEKFRGKVSYVRRLDTGVDIEYVGIPISELRSYSHRDLDYETETNVYMEKMGEFQADIYKRVSLLKDELRDKERQVSNWVYPDGSFGTGKKKGKKGKRGGAAKYLEKEGNKYIVRTTTPAGRRFPEGIKFQEQISKDIDDPTGIEMLGVKFANIIKLAESIDGNVFVYSNYAKASGAVPFSVCLEAQGYKMFNEPQSVFRSVTPTPIPTYCKSGDSTKVITIAKEKRYAYLAHGIVGLRLDAMLEVMNSYENRHGEYIKIFITTPVGGEGISLSNVLQIHLADSDWKHATNYQAESRAIRATSHDDLLKEGKLVVVKVYNHASYTCLPSVDVDLCEDGESELLSVDVDLYELSEKKDREIKRMERVIKRIAVDCQLHLLRNTRRGSPKIEGKDGTGECDYAECVYECWDPEPKYEDYSTYDVYYIDEPIEAVTRVIQHYFKTHFSVTMDKVVELIGNRKIRRKLGINIPAEMKYVQYAAEEILQQKVRFFNRYGQLSYLQKDGDVLFLTLDFPTTDVEDEINMDSDVVNYTSDLIGILDVALSDVPKPEEERKKELRVEELEKFDIYTPEFEKRFYNLKIKTLAEDLLEDALIRMEEGREDDLSVTILERLQQNLDPPDPLQPYVGMWYRIREPKNLIARIQKRLDVKSGLIRGRDGEFGKMQGRKPKTGEREPDKIIYDPSEMHDFRIDPGIGKEKYNWGGGDEDVYFHVLYSLQPKKKKKYAAVPTFNNVSGTIRIYKPSESTIDDSNEIKWRDATPVEQVAYSLWAQKKLYEFKQPYEASDAYGFYLAGKVPKFLIRTKFKEKKAIEEAIREGRDITKIDRRILNRGRNCGSYKIPELIEILQSLQLEPPDVDMEEIRDMTRDELVKEIIQHKKQVKTEDMDMENLYYVLAWLRHLGAGKEKEHIGSLCSIIEAKFLERELMFQTY